MEIEKLVEKITEEVCRRIEAESGSAPAAAAASAAPAKPAVKCEGPRANCPNGCNGLKCGDKCVNIAHMIDHTLLKPDATQDQVRALCEEARKYHFASVCVNTYNVPLAATLLAGSDVKVCCVIGFPLGAMSTRAKVAETNDAIENGAQEIDMVVNVGALKSGDVDFVREDIEAVSKACKGRAILKVIIETGLLTDEEKVQACQLSKVAGADFVKTSTGFSKGGATPEDIALMRKVVGAEMGVKASGGVRTYEDTVRMIKAGANRIGASASVAIVNQDASGASKGY